MYTSRYIKFYAEERNVLFSDKVVFTPVKPIKNNIVPKISSHIHRDIFEKMLLQSGSFFNNKGELPVIFQSTPVSWVRSHQEAPYFHSERDGHKVSDSLKYLNYTSESDRAIAQCILGSTLFFMWYISISDCYNLTQQPIQSFPFNKDVVVDSQYFIQLANSYNADLKANALRRVYQYKTSGRVEYDEFYPKKSKHIIDEIDRVLAQHYGFTDEELDYIINYDIKYRMGLVGGAGDEGDE